MSIELMMPSNHLILCFPCLLLPSIFPSIRVFSNESALRIRWPKYWSFSFNISPSNEHPGLISFRMDWFDLLAVQGTLKSLRQHRSSRASVLRHSAFFIVQLSQPMSPQFLIPTPWQAMASVCSSSVACSGPKKSMGDAQQSCHHWFFSISQRKVRGNHLAEVMRSSQHKC